MINDDVLKKCDLPECYNYEMLLLRCKECNKRYCHKHACKHGCKLYENILIECPKCKKIITDDIIDYDYKSENIETIKLINQQIDEINNNITREIKKKLEDMLKNRQSDNISFIFNKNITIDDVSDSIKKKYNKELNSLKEYKYKLILEEHTILGCYSKKKKSEKCSMCKKKNFLITCNKCDRKYCINHRLPEVHSCVSVN